MLTAWPIGETLPGPCQAVRTLKNSQQGGDLARHVQAADRRDVDPDEVDEPLRDKEDPLVAVHEKLAHRDCARGLQSENAKPDVFG
jgi:hypothetical protein